MYKTLGILTVALAAVVLVGLVGSYHTKHKYAPEIERPTRLYSVKGELVLRKAKTSGSRAMKIILKGLLLRWRTL